jgi:hypothetical protein
MVVLSLDVMDISGEHQTDLEHSIFKTRISQDGHELDSTRDGRECLICLLSRLLARSSIAGAAEPISLLKSDARSNSYQNSKAKSRDRLKDGTPAIADHATAHHHPRMDAATRVRMCDRRT